MRQYSQCEPVSAAGHYLIGALRDPRSRGGSASLFGGTGPDWLRNFAVLLAGRGRRLHHQGGGRRSAPSEELVETTAGFMTAARIALADRRLTSIGLGILDLAAACGFSVFDENVAAPSPMAGTDPERGTWPR